MALPIQIFLGLLVLASFVIAYFSARTWHWSYVLVVVGIFLSTLGFLVLAAETLRIYAVYGRQIRQLEHELADEQAFNNALVNGTEDPGIVSKLQSGETPLKTLVPDEQKLASMDELNHQLLLATRRRGRVWLNVKPAAAFDPTKGELLIAAEQPVPAGFPQDTIVYIFEEGAAQLPAANGKPQGPQYLGEFRITKSAAQQATLVPALPLDKFEQGRLAASHGPWAVYETMPADRYDIFAGVSDNDLKQRISQHSIDEYIRQQRQLGFDENGKPLPPDQVKSNDAPKRRLRDYATEFDELSRRGVAAEIEHNALQKDNERLAGALASAKQMQALREDQIKKLDFDLAGLKKEREAIEAHLAKVEQQLAKAKELLAASLKRNSELAAGLAAK